MSWWMFGIVVILSIGNWDAHRRIDRLQKIAADHVAITQKLLRALTGRPIKALSRIAGFM